MSNLASVIMEGATAVSTNLGEGYDFSGSAISESSYMNSACATLFSNVLEADQSYMVADVVGAAQIIHESRTVGTVDSTRTAAIQEGVVKSGIEKLKAAFQKFIAKVKEYYKRVIEWFKAMFASAEDFSKRYGAMIKTKSQKVKDFHYSGFKYTISAGDSKTDGFGDAVKKAMDALLGDGFNIASTSENKDEFHKRLREKVLKTDFKEEGAESASDIIDNFISKNSSASDVSDLRTEFIEAYQDGDTTRSDIKDFEANSIDEMLKHLKDSNNKTTKWESQLKTYEDKVNKVIQKLNAFTSKDGEEGGENLVSNASYVSSVMSAYLNLYKVPCEVKISMYKTISKEWLGVLKKFYNFKGNKGAKFESVSAEDLVEPGALGALESDTPDDVLDDSSDDSGKGGSGSDDDKGSEPASESAIASILETANAYKF
jgi:hypothetical protein